jgi:hypothetical protein
MDTPALDLNQIRLPNGWSVPPKRKPPKRLAGGFLRGPIPWPWLVRAMVLPGQALAVALILWREAGIEKRLTVSLKPARLRACRILPAARRRAIRYLTAAGLIVTVSKPGRCLEVTILDAPAPERNGN